MLNNDCGCEKKIGHWLRNVKITNYEFDSNGDAIVEYLKDNKSQSYTLPKDKLGMLASVLKTNVRSLLKRQGIFA